MPDSVFKVLSILEREERPVSGEDISAELKITRSAVWKQINELRALGYGISSSQKEGYKLVKKSGRLLPYEVQKKLKTRFIGKKMRYFENTPSTIWIGKEIGSEGDGEKNNGLVIIAEEQTGGMGRLGRAWVSPAGGIWVTILLKPKIPIDRVFMVTMAGSIAVAKSIRKEYDLGALIKWPNDIFVGGKKIAGLHLELSAEADRIHHCLLSIGIDVNVPVTRFAPELRATITSICHEIGKEVDRTALLARFLREFENRYLLIESGEYETILREWKSLSLTLEHHVQIHTMRNSFEGEAIDIDEFGALLVRKDNGRIERVISGDCIQR